MKTKKVSRVLALLLSLVMLLGSLPTAFAEEQDVIVHDEWYEQLLAAAQAGYYDELMACETMEEMSDIADRIATQQGYNFLDALTPEKLEAFEARVDELYSDFLKRTTYSKYLDFTNVAPFGEPITGTAAPITMFALAREGGDDTGNGDDAGDGGEIDNGIEVEKYVSATPNEKGEYTLTLEAWVTGDKVITEVREEVATDIILVLDQSISMSNTMPREKVYSLDQEKQYSVLLNGSYRAVSYCSDCGGWVNSTSNHWTNGFFGQINNHGSVTLFSPKTSENDTDNTHTQFYIQQTRLEALDSAVRNFIKTVDDKAKGADKDSSADDVAHRIAVVGFGMKSRTVGGTSNAFTGTELFYIDEKGTAKSALYNSADIASLYSQAFQDMKDPKALQNMNAIVDLLDDDGHTYVDLGMEMAQNILTANPLQEDETRNRIVVVFTDGVPGGHTDWGTQHQSTATAEAAIGISNEIKENGAKVYVVAVLNGADPSSAGQSPVNNESVPLEDKINWYLQNLSSNNGRPQDPGYYLSASDSTTLNNIFEKISGNVTGGSQTGTLTDITITKDIVAPSFVLPSDITAENIDGKVKLYTSDYSQNGFAAKGKTGWNEFEEGTVVLGSDGRTINVSNFEFAENWVGTEKTVDIDGNETYVYHGKKLVIEIPIKIREDFLGGNDVLTNSEGSGIYVDSNATTPAERFDSPDMDVPLKTITPVINDDHVYLSNTADLTRLIRKYTNDGDAYHRYTLPMTTTVKPEDNTDPDVEYVSPTPNDDGNYQINKTFTVDGVNNGYVDIVYTFKNKETNEEIAEYTIPAGATVGELVSGSTTVLLSDSTVYEITCSVSHKDPSAEGMVSQTKEGTVHIYKPTVTFKDSVVEYLDTVTEPNADAYYANNNLESKVWMRTDGTASTEVTMTGTEPTINLNYTADAAWLADNQQVVGTADVNVEVTATISSNDNPSVTNNFTVTSIRKACDYEGITCNHTTDSSAEAMGNSPEFVVHITNVEGNLKIVKEGLLEGESAIFTVEATRATGTGRETWTIVLTGKPKNQDGTIPAVSATITGLKANSEYSVVEQLAWVWGYTVDPDEEQTGKIKAADTVTETFTNTKTEQWLYDESAAVNTYEDLATTTTTTTKSAD